MGGHAIKNAERMSRKEYKTICMDLRSQYPNMMITHSFNNKDSFGDIDIVILGDIPKLKNTTEIVSNGTCTSVGIKYSTKIHQIDFFPVKTVEEQEHLHSYLSYGIFGMCVGICVNKFGLQFGMDGLKLKVDDAIYTLLSNNSKDIFTFLNLDLDTFHRGFEDENVFFDYIFSSPYISYDSLLKHSFKQNSRLQPLQQYIPKHQHKVKELAISYVIAFFGKQEEYSSILSSIEKRKNLQNKFNGKVIMEVFGKKLQGKEMGKFISDFKNAHDIENMTEYDIQYKIQELYNKSLFTT